MVTVVKMMIRPQSSLAAVARPLMWWSCWCWWCATVTVVWMTTTCTTSSVCGLSTSSAATAASSISDLLSTEQYAAQARRAEVERVLMLRDGQAPGPLLEPDYFSAVKTKKTTNRTGGGGFGGNTADPKNKNKRWSKLASLAGLQKERLAQDGVVRINQALSLDHCAALREHILQEQADTATLYQQSLLSQATAANNENERVPFSVEDYYGIEPGRTCRTDLLLSLLPAPVSDALAELFDSTNGKLRYLFENLVTKEGVLYELAGELVGL